MSLRFVACVAVAGAVTVAFAPPTIAQTQAPAPNGVAQPPMPRTADGRPDLNGVWGSGNPGLSNTVTRGNTQIVVFQFDGADLFEGKGLFRELDRQAIARKDAIKNRPPYKPELAAKVKELQDLQARHDPAFFCKPEGVPRMGAPNQIVQTPGQVVLLYAGRNTFRVVPTDGRPHRDDADPSWNGDAVGRWDGDTLVVESRNFTDESWLGSEGWFHSDQMRVIERFRREGNTLTWSATVEDPVVFTGPWELTPRRIQLLTDSSDALLESPPCSERSREKMVTDEHH